MFGGKDASKESTATPEGKTPAKDANIEAGQKHGHAEPGIAANIASAKPEGEIQQKHNKENVVLMKNKLKS